MPSDGASSLLGLPLVQHYITLYSPHGMGGLWGDIVLKPR